MTRYKEQPQLMGARRSLVGIVTEPVVPDTVQDRPVVVILNSGIIHRVGANRMSVMLARELAADGHAVVRFDLSGIGDSEPRRDGLAPVEASLADIREVLDGLEAARGARRFILAGLCSGADYSLIYAGGDARVVGTVLIDPSIPRTRGYYLHHFKRRLLRLLCGLRRVEGWRHAFGAVNRRVGAAAPMTTLRRPPYAPDFESPEVRAFLERAYAALMDNGVQLLAVFTGEREHRQSYREQLLDAFPRVQFTGRTRLEYFKDCDHIFSTEANRQRLVKTMLEWTQGAAFRVAAAPAPAGWQRPPAFAAIAPR